MTSRHFKYPISRYLIIAVMGLCAISLIMPNIAMANHAKKYSQKQIRVESGYGNGTAQTSVRYHNGSKQVRGPGGTWVSCFAGCDHAYREEFLDYWETMQENSE